MTVTLPPTYVTPYPETGLGGRGTFWGPIINAGQSYPPGMPNPVASSMAMRIDRYAGPDCVVAFEEVVQRFGWGIQPNVELKTLAAADQLCAEGGELKGVLTRIIRDLSGNPQIHANIVKYPTVGRVFSGGVLSGLHGVQHAIDGKGETAMFPIGNIGLNVNLSQIPEVMSAIHSARPVGSSSVDVRFAYNVGRDSRSSWAVLGNITLRVVGQVDKTASGKWSFKGVIRAFDDRYDANPSNHRSWLGERLTSALGNLMKDAYVITIPGEIPVNMVGQ